MKTVVAVIVMYWWAPALMVLGALANRHIRRSALRRLVFANLDSAAENGYFALGEYLFDMSADEIAYDMTCYAADFEGVRPETLTPYVLAWERARGFRSWEHRELA